MSQNPQRTENRPRTGSSNFHGKSYWATTCLAAVAVLAIGASLAWAGPADELAAQGKYDDAAAAHRKAITNAVAAGKDVGALRVGFAKFLQDWIARTPEMPPEKSRSLQKERLSHLQEALRENSSNKDARALMSDAHWQAAVLLRSWEPLLASVTEQIRLDPNNATAHFRAAMAHSALSTDQPRHVTGAIEAYQKATELAPRDIEFHLQWAQFLLQRGKAQDAGMVFAMALKRNPASAHLLAVQARFLLATDPATATKLLAQAENAANQTLNGYLAIGQFHLVTATGKPSAPDKAATALLRARELAPKDPRPYLWLARVERQRGRLEPGIAALREGLRVAEAGVKNPVGLSFEQRLQLRSALVDLHARLAGSLLDKWAAEPKNREKALADAKVSVDRLAALAPRHPMAAKMRGRYALAGGNAIEAEKLLRLAYDASPVFDRETAALLVRIYVAQNQPGEAETILAQIHKAVPDAGDVLLDMAQLQMQLRRPQKAREYLELAARRALTDKGKVRIGFLQRTVARAMGESVAKFIVPEKITSEAIQPIILEARQLASAGQTKQAGELYAAVLNQHPANEPLISELVELYRQAGEVEQAKAVVATGLKHVPASDRLKALQAVLNAANADERDQVLLAYIQKHETGVQRELRTATVHRGRGDRDAYRKHLRKALEIDPASTAAVEALFTDYLAARQYEQAAGLLGKARDANLDGAGGALYRARLSLAERKWDDAVRLLQGILAQRKRFSAGHVLLAQAFMGKNELHTARWHLMSAARQNPMNTAALVGLARIADIQMSRKDFVAATDTLQQARQLSPRSIGILLRLAEVYTRSENFKALDALVAEGRTFGQKDPAWWSLEARVYGARGQKENAADALANAYALAPTATTLLRYLSALTAAKRYDRVETVAAAAKDLSPTAAPRVKAMVAASRVAAGKKDEGIRTFGEAFALCVNIEAIEVAAQLRQAVGKAKCTELLTGWAKADANWAAQMALGHEHFSAGKLPEARAMMTKALPKTTGKARHLLALNLGTLLGALGEYSEAEKSYRDALAIDPNSAQALNNLAYLLADKLGRGADALPLARKAAGLTPEPNIMDTLGWAYFHAGKLAEAKRVLSEAIRLGPNTPIHYHLGRVLEKQGHKQDALRQYQAGKLRLADKPGNKYFKLCEERIQALQGP